MTKALYVKNLRKFYQGFELDVSFSIDEGETLAFIGPNGSGKTTIIYALLNIVRRDSGQIEFFGLDLDRHEVYVKQRLGSILEDPHFFDDLRVKRILEFCKSFYPTWDQEYASKLFESMDIDLEKKFKSLSKGMKSKVAITVAFASKPDLLILDEPTSGLDPKMRRLFVEKVREARRLFSPAVLLTSHIMKDVEDLADHVAFLKEGQVRLIEKCDEMKRWRVVEGFCNTSLTIKGINLRLEQIGERVMFKLLTDKYGQELINQLRDQEAEVKNIFAPDLEQIYDFIIE